MSVSNGGVDAPGVASAPDASSKPTSLKRCTAYGCSRPTSSSPPSTRSRMSTQLGCSARLGVWLYWSAMCVVAKHERNTGSRSRMVEQSTKAVTSGARMASGKSDGAIVVASRFEVYRRHPSAERARTSNSYAVPGLRPSTSKVVSPSASVG
eukprot:2005697-Prymnesium_polylepis.1